MPFARSTATTILTAAILVALASPPSHATVSGNYVSTSKFSFTVTNIPDFDQVRKDVSPILGLVTDGKMYSVPASNLNLTAYIAKHGYSSLSPGVTNWQNNSTYNLVTQNLALLGEKMNTSPATGTTGTNGYNGLGEFIANPYLFDVDRYYPSGSYSPTTSTIGQIWLNGGVASFCYGRYEHAGSVLTNRTGGHCVTPTKVAKIGISSQLSYRDPASGGLSLVNQSPFMNTTLDTIDKTFLRNGKSHVMSEMQTSANDNILRIIDSVYAIFPISSLTDSPAGISFFKPSPLKSYNVPAGPLSFDTNTIQDLAQSPDNAEAYVLTKALPGGLGGKLHKIDQISRTDTIMGFTFNDPKAILFNRRQELYIVDGDSIICVDVKSVSPTVTTAPLPSNQYSAIACDPNTDEVLLLKSGPGAEILVFPPSLTGTPVSRPLPATIPLSGKAWFDCSQADNSLWICAEGDNTVYQAVIDPVSGSYIQGTTIADPSIVNPRCIHLRRSDQLFFACDGAVKEYRNDPAAGWQEALDGAFIGTIPGNCFAVSRSNTNHDPAIHEPDWDNDTDPSLLFQRTESPDCTCDLDHDGDVDLDDLDELLLEFGETGFWRSGDIDQNGIVDLNDMQFLLLSFGSTCP